ncbi:60S ribosomal protein L37a-like [Rattus rattus]|uniref:60S ribosomal protein L37a-like n=1 Tax=Rattus rattus TaxID=10117 RepID=UPI0013F32700|nr:60S ribosomal protein L37a-like [Rattus rattus]
MDRKVSAETTGATRPSFKAWAWGQCTKKVRIALKYGTRYGASLWKMVKKIEVSQHAKYTCSFCAKTKTKRRAVGFWHCGSCMKTVAGGAWTYNTTSAVTVKSAIRRLEELKDQKKPYRLRPARPALNGLIYRKGEKRKRKRKNG